MPISPALPENSSGILPESALDSHHLRDVNPPRKHLRSSVNEPEQSTKTNKRLTNASVLNRPKSYSSSLRTTVGLNTHDTHHHEHGEVRTLPRKPSI